MVVIEPVVTFISRFATQTIKAIKKSKEQE